MNGIIIQDILSKVTFAPSCVDMGWTWEVTVLGDGDGYLIRTTFRRPDRDTGEVNTGYGRWWHMPNDVTESGVVKTAFAAAKLILEHELLEAFRYEDVRLFDPHHDVDALKCAARVHENMSHVPMLEKALGL